MVEKIKIIKFEVKGVMIEEIREVVKGRKILKVEKLRNMKVGIIK